MTTTTHSHKAWSDKGVTSVMQETRAWSMCPRVGRLVATEKDRQLAGFHDELVLPLGGGLSSSMGTLHNVLPQNGIASGLVVFIFRAT